VLGVVLDEATAKQDSTGCMKFVSSVLYDDAFHELPDNATHTDRMHAAGAWRASR
jgi:hypothetical protein